MRYLCEEVGGHEMPHGLPLGPETQRIRIQSSRSEPGSKNVRHTLGFPAGRIRIPIPSVPSVLSVFRRVPPTTTNSESARNLRICLTGFCLQVYWAANSVKPKGGGETERDGGAVIRNSGRRVALRLARPAHHEHDLGVFVTPRFNRGQGPEKPAAPVGPRAGAERETSPIGGNHTSIRKAVRGTLTVR